MSVWPFASSRPAGDLFADITRGPYELVVGAVGIYLRLCPAIGQVSSWGCLSNRTLEDSGDVARSCFSNVSLPSHLGEQRGVIRLFENRVDQSESLLGMSGVGLAASPFAGLPPRPGCL